MEDVFLQDLNTRSVEVIRDSKFISYTTVQSGLDNGFTVQCKIGNASDNNSLRSKYLVGCDGAHSLVRKSMPGIEMVGEPSRAAWGVLDGTYKFDASLVVICTNYKGRRY